MTPPPTPDPAPGLRRASLARRAVPLAALVSLALAWGLAAASPADRKDIVLRGLVSDEKGRPLSEARVSAYGPQGLATVTDENGRFTLALQPGTLGELGRSPSHYTVEVKHRGHRIPLLGGDDKLVLELRATPAGGEDAHVVVSASAPALARTLQDQLATRGPITAWGEVEFSRRRPAAGPSARPAPKAPVAEARPAAPGEPARTPAAPAPKPAAAPPASAPRPAPASAVEAAPAPARADSAPPGPAAPPAPARVQSAPAPDTARRPAERQGLTALELLDEVKRHGSLTASERYADSVRVAERDRARRAAAAQREAERAEKARRKDESRARRLAADRMRDSLEATPKRETPAPPPVAAQVSPPPPAGMPRETPPPAPSKAERQAAAASAKQARRAEARRKAEAERAAQAEANARRAEQHRAEAALIAFRRDSVFQALRARDSLRRAAFVRDSVRTAARRDSLRALRPPLAPLHAGIGVGGREVGARTPLGMSDSCACRIRGTVEIVMDGRLDAPPRVTISVRGRPEFRDVVQLFMGSPRAFEIPGVPCGAISLEVATTSRIHLVPRDPQSLANLPCTSGGLIQPRIELVPAAPR